MWFTVARQQLNDICRTVSHALRGHMSVADGSPLGSCVLAETSFFLVRSAPLPVCREGLWKRAADHVGIACAQATESEMDDAQGRSHRTGLPHLRRVVTFFLRVGSAAG
jgi:hypothetical protein